MDGWQGGLTSYGLPGVDGVADDVGSEPEGSVGGEELGAVAIS